MKKNDFTSKPKYGIRKFSTGVVSTLIGLSFIGASDLLLSNTVAHAQTNSNSTLANADVKPVADKTVEPKKPVALDKNKPTETTKPVAETDNNSTANNTVEPKKSVVSDKNKPTDTPKPAPEVKVNSSKPVAVNYSLADDDKQNTPVNTDKPVNSDNKENNQKNPLFTVDGIQVLDMYLENNGTRNVVSKTPKEYQVHMKLKLTNDVKPNDKLVYDAEKSGYKFYQYDPVNNTSTSDVKIDRARRETSVDKTKVYPITTRIGSDNITIGSLKGNTITFNENLKKVDDAVIDVSLGIGSQYALRSESGIDKVSGDFYVNLNGKEYKLPEKVTFHVYNKLKSFHFSERNAATGAFNLSPFPNGQIPVTFFLLPGDLLTNTGDKVQAKINFPDTFQVNPVNLVNKKGGIMRYLDGNRLVDDKRVQDDYFEFDDPIKYSLNSNNNALISDIELLAKRKPEKNYIEFNILAPNSKESIVNLKDPSFVNWDTGELKEPIKVEYLKNGKLISSLTMDKLVVQIPKSEVDGAAKHRVTTKEESRTEAVPFETIYENTDTLLSGQQKVKTEGKNGVRTIVEQVSFANGQELGRKVLSNDITTQPINKVILVGTKPNDVKVTTKEETRTEEIKYTTKYEKDNTLPSGVEKVKQEGKNGVRTVVEQVSFAKGQEIGRKIISTKVTTQPVDHIIVIGTKEDTVDIKTKKESHTEVIPAETITLKVDHLPVGKTEVVVQPVNGERKVTEEITYADGKEVGRKVIENTVTKQPVHKVVFVGKKWVAIDPTKAIVKAPTIDVVKEYTAIDNQPIQPIKVKVSNPEAKVTVEGLPNGLTYNEKTKQIEGKPSIPDWKDATDKEQKEVARPFKVKVTATNANGGKAVKDLTITVLRDSDKDGNPDITDKEVKSPEINPVHVDDKEITGTTEPGNKVTITLPDGKTAEAKVDDKGHFKAELPKDTQLKVGDKLSAIATNKDGKKSQPVEVTVLDAEKVEAPNINPVYVGDKEVTGNTEPGNKVTFTLPDGQTVEAKVDDKGNFKAELPKDTQLKAGDKLSAVATNKEDKKSDAVVTTVLEVEAPKINPVYVNDKEVTGITDPDNKVTVTLPDEATIEAKVDDKGHFKADLPKDTQLKVGEKLSAVATNKEDKKSVIAVTTVLEVEAPKVNPVHVGDKEVTGTTKQGNKVTLTLPDGQTIEAKVDDKGNFKAELPKDVELKVGEKLSAVAINKDGKKSQPVEVTVSDKNNKSASNHAGGKSIVSKTKNKENGQPIVSKTKSNNKSSDNNVLPKTGVVASASAVTLGLVLTSVGSLFTFRKRKN